MNKFWGGESESESDSESIESDQSSSGDEGGNFFFNTSSSDDDDKRVMKSTKEKRLDELKAKIAEIKDSIEENDWNGILAGFDSLNKQYEKAKNVVASDGTPMFYTRALVRVEDAHKKAHADKDAKKKMSTTCARSLNAMKQKLKRHNKTYESDMAKFRANPVDTDDEEEDEEEDDESADEEEKPKKIEPKKKEGFEVPNIPEKVVWTPAMVKTRLSELTTSRGKKGTDTNKQLEELAKLLVVCKDVQTRVEVLVVMIAAQFDTRNSATHMPVIQWKNAHANLMEVLDVIDSNPHLSVVEADQNSSAALAPTSSPLDDQPKQAVDVLHIAGSLLAFVERLDDEFVKSLQHIDPHTQEYADRLRDENLFLLIAVRLESYYRSRDNSFAVHRLALRRIERLYYRRNTLNPLKVLHLGYNKGVQAKAQDQVKPKADEGDWNAPETPRGTTDFSQMTPVKALKDKLEQIEGEGEKGEGKKVEGEGDKAVANVSVLGTQGVKELDMSILQVVADLAAIIYKSSDERAKTRAVLCHVYNLALEDHYHEAKDLFLMSHLQDTVQGADIATQILFNRTMVQMGLCAFRHGHVYEAHSCVAELYASGRVKELLAQGVASSRFGEKNLEQEKAARLRQIPYHMHVSLDLVDAVHLVSAMLLEVPFMALHSMDSKRKIISKQFRRLLDNHHRQVFNGPPENNHDFIMAASRALSKGLVDQCCQHITNLKVWDLMPNTEALKTLLTEKIREQGLRTYMFTYSHLYSSISAERLSSMFHLPLPHVHAMLSKMMFTEDLCASWHEPTSCVVMHREEATRLQSLASQLADKAGVVIENNEKHLETIGGFGFDHSKRDQYHARRFNRARYGGRYNTQKPSEVQSAFR